MTKRKDDTGLDFGALRLGIERCDPDLLLGLYAEDAHLSIVSGGVSQASPFELRGKSEIAKHLRAVFGQGASHRVEREEVGDENGVKFREACEYPDGSRVVVETTLEVKDGKIVRQVDVVAKIYRRVARRRSSKDHSPERSRYGWMSFQAMTSHGAQVSEDKERTHRVKHSTPPSGSHSLICPICEAGELVSGHSGVQCPICGCAPSRGVLEALRQIIALPNALGSHACEECGHPEMRRLPDGVSHCPGCGSEVLPTRSNGHTEAVDTSGGPRQGGVGGHPAAVPPPEKYSQRQAMRAPERDTTRTSDTGGACMNRRTQQEPPRAS